MRYATHAEIDLDAIAHNVRLARAQAPGAQTLVAIKANAYGHGAVPVALHLAEAGLADWFGVATIPEGIELRAAGIEAPILKFAPACSDDELAAALEHNITLTVHDTHTIDAVARAAAGARVSVQLAVDTGMRRIGCEPADAPGLASRIEDAGLALQGIFTHLPISDAPAGEEFTHEQLARFAALVEEINLARRAAGLPPVELVHAANSGAVLGHQFPAATMIRPGIMVYGYYPDAHQTPRSVPLRQALTWKSQVSYVKRIAAGETVGYGRSWTAPTDRWIATVPVGYADGFSRLNSNRGRMLIGGHSFPVAGRVCMDQTMLDLGPASGAEPPAQVGDEVVILGRQGDQFISTDELADLMGTISYEVTCLIAPRVERVYRTTSPARTDGTPADPLATGPIRS